MEFQDIFTSRDQSFTNINIGMNYLSRLVRENLTVFNYDAAKNAVTFLSDTDKLIKCTLAEDKGHISFKDFTLEAAEGVFSDEKIDNFADGCVKHFISSLHENKYTDAEYGFSQLLTAWESRNAINEARTRLEKRRARFDDSQNILGTSEWAKLTEVKDKVVEFVKENKETLLQYEDVVNSIKLTNALGKAFNLPKTDWNSLVEANTVNVEYDTRRTVFEMIATQELIRNELTESKENFVGAWVGNTKIAKLASCIYENEEKIRQSLAEAVKSVPYLALSSKSDIKGVFGAIYEASDIKNISQKDIREFVSKIFEMKKPMKLGIIQELNESYGINVQNMKFVPTFSNLAKAQSVLFEALAHLSDKDSIIRDVFAEFAKSVHKKGGIQTLEVNDFIAEVLDGAEINRTAELYRPASLDKVVEAIDLTSERQAFGGKKALKDDDDKGDPKAFGGKKKGKKDDDGDDEGDPKAFGGKKGDKSKTRKGNDFELSKDQEEEMDVDDDKDIDDKDLSKLRKGKKGKKDVKDKDKGAGLGLSQDDVDEAATYSPVETDDNSAGMSDGEMGNLMGELETLFQDIDWDAIAQEDSDLEDDGVDYDGEMTDREFSTGDDAMDQPYAGESPGEGI
tara:strand:- start:1372 stop:3243 length:1872 start_codon:yes stop_codon:yes gene_type:complete